MIEEATNTEQSRVAADCPNKRVVLLHYDAIPILIEFIKKCRESTDEAVRIGAMHTLSRWDKARTSSNWNADEGRSELSGVLGGGITPKQAMDALRKAMQEDYGYAWSWHCNVAMAAVDAGAPHKEANERAAGFMRNAFGVDTRLPPNGQG